MTDKTEVKAPNPATVEKAMEKMSAGDDLNQREQAALEAQAQIDQENGWRRIEWKPGLWLLQSLSTQHTEPDTEQGELNMRAHLNEYRLR